MPKTSTLEAVLKQYKEISLLSSIKNLLDWDLNVFMPPQASDYRANQNAYLTAKLTKLWKDPQFIKDIADLTDNTERLTPKEQAMLRNLNKSLEFYIKLPEALIIKKEEVTAKAVTVWQEAKSTNNYKIFEPYLSEIIELNKQTAQHLGYADNPYDALLDRFEPELTALKCRTIFDQLKSGIIPLTKAIQSSKEYITSFPTFEQSPEFPVANQQTLSKYIAEQMGFRFHSGRLDVSAHPFTIELGPGDVRMTTHYAVNDFRDSLTSTMHETGHALYEQGIDPEYADTPLAGGTSFGVHEALSRFWENQIGRSAAFLEFLSPTLHAMYPALATVDTNTIVKMFNHVRPSLIRIEADEVTYSLHIIVRFELEDAMLNGKLVAKDIPEAWRAKMKEYFSVEPETDTKGALQDIHWAFGEFGYFPSYALGNVYASQFLHVMKKDLKVDDLLHTGNLLPIKDWLDSHVHQHGSLYWPQELLKLVTHEHLNPQYFIQYLQEKYSKLYP